MRLLESTLPIVAAPMAGGPTSSELIAAVAGAGAFPFIAGGYKTPAALAEEIRATRDLGVPFGVNVFVPSRDPLDELAFQRYAHELNADAESLGVRIDPVPKNDDDHWDEKISLLLENPVPVISFTFGLPSAETVAALQRAGSIVLSTLTTPDEARAAKAVGVDGVIAQAPVAGGHSATFDPYREVTPVDGADLIASIRAEVDLPIIAAGGVDGPGEVARLLGAGAESVAVGTLLLRADEAGTSLTHRAALANPAFTDTTMTRVFTGRPARALRNAFINAHGRNEITGYPAVHHLTRPIRQAAAAEGDAQRLHLWAGTGYRSARTGPAAGIIEQLAEMSEG